jgi:hypothetical protein
MEGSGDEARTNGVKEKKKRKKGWGKGQCRNEGKKEGMEQRTVYPSKWCSKSPFK